MGYFIIRGKVMRQEYFHRILLISICAILIFSAIDCHDIFTWFLEVLPAIIEGIVLIVTYKKFKFTNFVYLLIWFHAIINNRWTLYICRNAFI